MPNALKKPVFILILPLLLPLLLLAPLAHGYIPLSKTIASRVARNNGKGVYAIEIKRTVSPKISKGFRLACEEIKPKQRFYVIPTNESYPMDKETQAIGIEELITLL